MPNDTTRMEKLADDLSAVTIPSCKHMEREEYRDCVLQMLDDLEQLGRRDGCIAAAWALDALPSLQRELAEARRELFLAREGCQLAIDNMHCEDEQDIAMTSHTLQEILNGAPAPSDVKGDHIAEPTKLVPLTDPSVRGVLVDNGEPRQLRPGQMGVVGLAVYQHPAFSDGPSASARWQPVKLRPASDFGVAARGEPGLKKLPEDVVGLLVKGGEPRAIHPGEICILQHQRDPIVWEFTKPTKDIHQPIRIESPAIYGIPDGGERIKELEAGMNRHFVEVARLRRLHQEAFRLAVYHQSDAERLRKAIENGIECIKRQGNPVAFSWISECLYGLQAALSPSPAAASGGWLNKMADAEDAAGDISIGTSAPAAESQGNAQHHIEGAKILEGGSGSAAAESEVRTTRKREPRTYKEELEWRLAACEERCRELEDGIERHRRLRTHISAIASCTTADTDLWSLLAPKAGGESQTPPNKPEYTTCGRCGERYVGRMCPAGC